MKSESRVSTVPEHRLAGEELRVSGQQFPKYCLCLGDLPLPEQVSPISELDDRVFGTRFRHLLIYSR